MAPSGDRPSSSGSILRSHHSRPSSDSTDTASSRDHHRVSRLLKGRSRRSERPVSDRDVAAASGGPADAIISPSDDSLPLTKSIASSLITEDSDSSDSHRPRPTLSPHQSHAGYLTLSSPLIASEAVEPIASSVGSPSSDVSTPVARTSSPATKLKEAFVPAKRSQDVGADSDSQRSSGNRRGLGGLFGSVGKKDKAALTAARRASHSADELLQPHDAPDHNSTSGNTSSASNSASDRPNTPAKQLAAPRRLTTSFPSTPPNTTSTPTTLVTPPTPTELSRPDFAGRPALARPRTEVIRSRPSSSSSASQKGSKNNNNSSSSSSSAAIPPVPPVPPVPPLPEPAVPASLSHRRVRSTSTLPSKLSNSLSTPLTPTLEETKTPGGSLTSPSFPPANSSGFFSSVFSAAQNAATQITTTIANNPITSGKNSAKTTPSIPQTAATPGLGTTEEGGGGVEEVIGPETGISAAPLGGDKRRPAVETLGSGSLSLDQLGISSDPAAEADSSMSESTTALNDGASAKIEDFAASQAVSAAYASDRTPTVKASTVTDRARSRSNTPGNATPPRTQSNGPDMSTVHRSGSVRSRLSGRRRRHRGSSAATGTSVAAAIIGSTTNLGSMNNSSTQKLTGFAVASSKRNRDFHQLFRSVPEDDYLIEDYSAALQKDILLHGRLYVSEGHICFSSNILGWVTNLVISFDEVVSVEKKSTAVIFPNAIIIQTLHARNVFASFISRDSTYDLLIGIWKISHPNLKSSANGVMLDGSAGTGDKTEKAESVATDDASMLEDSDDDEEVYDEDAEEEEEGLGSFIDTAEGSMEGGGSGSGGGGGGGGGGEASDVGKLVSRKTSANMLSGPAANGGSAKMADVVDAAMAGAAANPDFPGPQTHAPTDCGDQASHFDKMLLDTTIPAPLGKIYSLMFGPESGAFMRRWLVEDQKSTELQMEDDKKGLGEDQKSFNYSYIKPLNAPIGPKQTKCLTSTTLEQFDLEKAVTVVCTTQTPDVPSGNAFIVKTRYCLMWAPGNGTRFVMNFTVEWSGKSWIKGPIEKGASDGQMGYGKDLVAALRTAVVPKPLVKAAGKVKGKGRKKRGTNDGLDVEARIDVLPPAETSKLASKSSSFSGPLGPVLSVFNSPIAVALLSLLVVYMWLRQPSLPYSPASGIVSFPGMATPQRIAAYEEIWQKEESELWKWLEDRAGMDRSSRLHSPPPEVDTKKRKQRQAQSMGNRLEDEILTDLQMDEAIRITEEKLEALKLAVDRKKRQRNPHPESPAAVAEEKRG